MLSIFWVPSKFIHAYLPCKYAFPNPLIFLLSFFYGLAPSSILQWDPNLMTNRTLFSYRLTLCQIQQQILHIQSAITSWILSVGWDHNTLPRFSWVNQSPLKISLGFGEQFFLKPFITIFVTKKLRIILLSIIIVRMYKSSPCSPRNRQAGRDNLTSPFNIITQYLNLSILLNCKLSFFVRRNTNLTCSLLHSLVHQNQNNLTEKKVLLTLRFNNWS